MLLVRRVWRGEEEVQAHPEGHSARMVCPMWPPLTVCACSTLYHHWFWPPPTQQGDHCWAWQWAGQRKGRYDMIGGDIMIGGYPDVCVV